MKLNTGNQVIINTPHYPVIHKAIGVLDSIYNSGSTCSIVFNTTHSGYKSAIVYKRHVVNKELYYEV